MYARRDKILNDKLKNMEGKRIKSNENRGPVWKVLLMGLKMS